VTLDAGHADIGLDFDGGSLVLNVHDQTVNPEQQRAASSVVLRVKDAAEVAVPDDPSFAVLGSPGDSVWILPQVQDDDLLWLGWNTEDIDSGTMAGDRVRLHLRSVSGPGNFLLFTTGSFGAIDVIFNSTDGIDAGDALDVTVPSHAHGNWTFTAPGTYQIELQLTGTLVDGGAADSGSVTYTFNVGTTAGDGASTSPGSTQDTPASEETTTDQLPVAGTGAQPSSEPDVVRTGLALSVVAGIALVGAAAVIAGVRKIRT
jgi:surface-anchored protein